MDPVTVLRWLLSFFIGTLIGFSIGFLIAFFITIVIGYYLGGFLRRNRMYRQILPRTRIPTLVVEIVQSEENMEQEPQEDVASEDVGE